MKSVLYEYSIDSLLTSDERDHVQYLIGESLRDCEVEKTFDPEDLPFILYFEKTIKDKLIKAGFKKDVLENRKRFETTLKNLDRQGSGNAYFWTRDGLPYGFPRDVVDISREDNKMYWIDSDIDAALRALQSMTALKQLLQNNEAVKIYLRSLEMIVNLFRSGNAPELAEAEAKKLDKSRWTRTIKKLLMRRAIKLVFDEFPKNKTLGVLWNKFDFVNKNKPFTVTDKDTRRKENYIIETGKNVKGKDIVIITGDQGRFEYSKRSLQHFIDELK